MASRTRHRPGFALATAIVTLGVIGALIIGTFFVSTHEHRTGADVLHTTRALNAAELGVESAMTAWRAEWNTLMRRGDRWRSPSPILEAASVATQITRLDDQLILISSEGMSGPARRVVRRFVALDTPQPDVRAAASIRGPVIIDESARIDATDRAPDGWNCPDSGPARAGIATPDSSLVSTSGCATDDCVTGSPPILADSALGVAGALLRLGELDWSELTQRATSIIETSVSPVPSERDGACDVEDPRNWGEPSRPGAGVCFGHFRVAHAQSDLTITGGRGQGILLVDGDLTIHGGFEFTGIAIVRGALSTGVGGGRIRGMLSVAAMDGSTASTLRDLTVQLSTCAIHAAMIGTARPRPVIERSWFEAIDGQ
ncbi:MAG: hypothetical protein ACT4PJ_10745 [Gemmatimonadaceae bacterium]